MSGMIPFMRSSDGKCHSTHKNFLEALASNGTSVTETMKKTIWSRIRSEQQKMEIFTNSLNIRPDISV